MRALRGVTHFYQGAAAGPAGNDDANLKNSIRIQRQFVACCPNAACTAADMRRHMPHATCGTRVHAMRNERRCPF